MGGKMSLSDFSDLEAKVLSTIEGVLKKVKFLKEYGHFYKMVLTRPSSEEWGAGVKLERIKMTLEAL